MCALLIPQDVFSSPERQFYFRAHARFVRSSVIRRPGYCAHYIRRNAPALIVHGVSRFTMKLASTVRLGPLLAHNQCDWDWSSTHCLLNTSRICKADILSYYNTTHHHIFPHPALGVPVKCQTCTLTPMR